MLRKEAAVLCHSDLITSRNSFLSFPTESLEVVVHSSHQTKAIPAVQWALDLPVMAVLQLPSELIICEHECACVSIHECLLIVCRGHS